MFITLFDGTEIEVIDVAQTNYFVKGANRNVLTIQLKSVELSLSDVEALFTPENCETITYNETEFTGYCHPYEFHRTSVMVTPEDAENPATYENRYVVNLAQRTYLETQLEQLRADIDFIAIMMEVFL